MTCIEQSIYIHATSEIVDKIALNSKRIPEWYVGMQRLEVDDHYPEVDGEAAFVLDVAGFSVDGKAISVRLEPGDIFMYRLEGMITGLVRWSHTPEASGTRLTVTQQYQLTGGAFEKLIERKLREDLAKSLCNLAVLVESERAYMEPTV